MNQICGWLEGRFRCVQRQARRCRIVGSCARARAGATQRGLVRSNKRATRRCSKKWKLTDWRWAEAGKHWGWLARSRLACMTWQERLVNRRAAPWATMNRIICPEAPRVESHFVSQIIGLFLFHFSCVICAKLEISKQIHSVNRVSRVLSFQFQVFVPATSAYQLSLCSWMPD